MTNQPSDFEEQQNSGQGVSAIDIFEPEKDDVIGITADAQKTPLLTKRQVGKPFIRDQLTKFPESVSVKEIQNLVLNTSIPEDLAKLNTIDTRVQNIDGGLQLLDRDKQFHEGKWLIFLTVAHLEFSSIID